MGLRKLGTAEEGILRLFNHPKAFHLLGDHNIIRNTGRVSSGNLYSSQPWIATKAGGGQGVYKFPRDYPDGISLFYLPSTRPKYLKKCQNMSKQSVLITYK